MLTLADPLRHAEDCSADAIAIVDGDSRFTFGQLVGRCRRVAAAVRRDTQPGDRVALLATNGHRALELILSTPAAGRVVVPLNGRLAIPELAYQLRDAEPQLLVTDWSQDRVRELANLAGRVLSMDDYEAWLGSEEDAGLGDGVSQDDVAGLFYTGGTTGAAKGVMLTHGNKLADALHVLAALHLVPEDAWVVLGPMYHASGTWQAEPCLWTGARQILIPAYEPALVLDLIEREGVTVAFGVPAMLDTLTREQARSPRDVSSLRLMGYGAAPASTAILRRFHESFPRCELVSMYGATELAPLGTVLHHMEDRLDTPKVRSAGPAAAGVRLRVTDREGRDVSVGTVGEVCVRGPNVMKGYWRKPEETARALRDGWYHSGDLGRFDDDHCLYLVDRAKDMIISGGENVYSTEVEEVLSQHPDVVECAVFGVPDERWGEAVRAIVVLREGAEVDAEALGQHCRGGLGGYKVPKQIEVSSEPLPRSAAGKILKRELRAPFWVGHDEAIS
ncbi:MAG: AMP-binding protein [Candidatus Binatia bacterium]|nr:AMP-binding protein [Candidatus Binatia bacterium]